VIGKIFQALPGQIDRQADSVALIYKILRKVTTTHYTKINMYFDIIDEFIIPIHDCSTYVFEGFNSNL